jgi:hypothetical protein
MFLIYAIPYAVVAMIVGSFWAAKWKREKIEDGRAGVLNDDQHFEVIVCGLFWIVSIWFLIGGILTNSLVAKETDQKCILCGARNARKALHCNSCGNILTPLG